MSSIGTDRIRLACAAAFVAVIAACAAALAQETTPETTQQTAEDAEQPAEPVAGPVTQPEPKPLMLIAKPEPNPMLPRPRPDPDEVARGRQAKANAPEPESGEPIVDAAPEGLVTGAVDAGEESPEEEACLWRLRGLGVAIAPQPPIETAQGCRIAAPLAVRELSPEIFVDPEVMLTCPAAEAVTRWMQDVVVPAAQEYLESSPTGLVQASSVACTETEADPGSAAHVSGNAIDVTGFMFADRAVFSIQSPNEDKGVRAARERAFMRTIREGACRYFRNVVSPDGDDGHPGRLHLAEALPEGETGACR